ncbi:unnamed protein product, partial [marine sediment metagenome]
ETVEDSQELILETVSLKFLDARDIMPVIKTLSSKHGSISVDGKSNSLIICDTKEVVANILAQIRRAEQTMTPQSIVTQDTSTPELFVETAVLKFLDAKNLMAAIKQMSSEFGTISTDDNSNSLIVCDTKENLEMILNQIEKADRIPQQIMIEVVILDVQLNDDTEIGINWDLLSDKNYNVAYRQNFTETRLSTNAAFETVGFGGEFSVISGTVRNLVHLIQQRREVEVLASPRVMTVSGQSASIESIDEIPYEEESQSSQGGVILTYTEFKDVGVKLKVSPIVTD